MKLWIPLLLMTFLLHPSDQDSPIQALQEAEAAYNQGLYGTAINIYETLIDTHYTNSAVYYNLGNAYYHAEELGYALLNYHRASRLSPRDNLIRQGIERIRNERVMFQPEERSLLDRLSSLSTQITTEQELFDISGIIWATWCCLIGVCILSEERRRKMRWILAAVSIVLLLCFGLLFARIYTQTYRPEAAVLNTTKAMSGPGTNYLELFTLYPATEIRVLEIHEGWARFTLPDQQQGWLPNNAYELVYASSSGM